MSFYETLAPHYDSFFPPNPATLDFVHRAGIPGSKRAYDAGCATGSAALDLARDGWDVLGVDLCAPMIDIAREKVTRLGAASARFACGDMTDRKFVDTDRPWSLVLCLGNTLPHLDENAVAGFFQTLKSGMEPGGLAIFQTLNYAHPDIKEGFVFPILESGAAVFCRRYSADSPGGLIFETDIVLNGQIYSDRTRLTPISPDAIRLLLARSGFGDIQFAAGWESSGFDRTRDRYLITTARS